MSFDDIRNQLSRTMGLNEQHVAASAAAEVTLTIEEAELIESLKAHPAFRAYPKDQIDRHTLKGLLIATHDSPVSVCERAARKCEILISRGDLNESLQPIDDDGKLLTESGSLFEDEVPEEMPHPKEGDGDLPQGPADSTSSEHDGEDVPNPGSKESEVKDDEVTGQDGEGSGDKSELAKKGYKQEESADVEHGHDEEDAFKLESEDDEDMEEDCGAEDSTIPAAGKGEKGKETGKVESRRGRKVKEQDDMEPMSEPMESDDDADDDLNEEGAEGSENDAPDPAPEEDRAASDARWKDGAGQNESETQKDVSKDIADTPDYDEVEKEDPSNDPKNKGAADPKLESLDKVEARICKILSEAGLKKGTQKWNEAYVKGWNLAMEHRAGQL